jgi:hypothetical protein
MANKSLCIILMCAVTTMLVYNGFAEPEEVRKQDAKSKDKVEVYLARGEGGEGAGASTNIPLSQIELEDVPLITSDDMLYYNGTTDSFLLNTKAYDAVRELKVEVYGKTFVLMVGKRRVYRGALWNNLSSVPFDGVVIVQPMGAPNTELHLELGYPTREVFTGKDPRHDPEVLKILEGIGKTSDGRERQK